MILVVGLGNPGMKYKNTYHNVGFMAIDALAKRLKVKFDKTECDARTCKGNYKGVEFVFAKPETYMNLSGECVRELLNFFKFDETSDLIVISDDISLPVGQIRVRKKGSAGGHNGLKNIIQHLGHDCFVRIKVGVGEKPAGWDLADYVLGRFSGPEQERMDEAAKAAADAVRCIIREGADAAMNRYNRKTIQE